MKKIGRLSLGPKFSAICRYMLLGVMELLDSELLLKLLFNMLKCDIAIRVSESGISNTKKVVKRFSVFVICFMLCMSIAESLLEKITIKT